MSNILTTLKKLLPIFILIFCFLGIIFYTEPPKSWGEASSLQWIVFYCPILLLITYLAQFYFRFWIRSLIIGLCFVLTLSLYGLELLGIGSFLGILVGGGVLIKLIKPKDQYQKVISPHKHLKLKRQ
jgi:hypothetical protein